MLLRVFTAQERGVWGGEEEVKGISPLIRKRYKQYLRDNTTDTSKELRQRYSDVMCGVIVEVMKDRKHGGGAIDDMDQVRHHSLIQ